MAPRTNLFPTQHVSVTAAPSSISYQLIAATALFILAILGIILFTIITIQNQKLDSLVIDLAGRQRMLHQRHMKEVILVSQGHQADYMTTRTIAFETLQALLHGGVARVNLQTNRTDIIPSAPSPALIEKLQAQQTLLAEFAQKADTFLQNSSTDSHHTPHLHALLDLTANLHTVADEAVRLYSLQTSSKIQWMIRWELIIGAMVAVLGIFLTRQVLRATRALKEETASRQQSELSLQESEKRYEQIVTTAKEAIITMTSDQHILLFNSAAESLFGLPSPSAKGQPFSQFLSAQSSQWLTQHIHASHSREGQEAMISEKKGLHGRRANGQEFPAEATIQSITISDQTFFTIIFRDRSSDVIVPI